MRNYLTFITIFAVIVTGTVGYCLAGLPFYESLLSSLALLMLNAPIEPSNAFIEIGRWLGVIFVLNVVYSVIETAILTSADDLKVRRKARREDAVAVHGDGIYAEKLAQNIGPRAIRSDRDASFKAPLQVVLFTDEKDTLKFYSKHYDQMLGAQEIYVGLFDTTPLDPVADNVFVFQMPSICAQLYWEQYPVVSNEKIVLIGDDPYMRALLTQGLMVNIYSIEGGVQYSVFGDFAQYRALHPMLEEAVACNADTLTFCDTAWASELVKLKDADRIIVGGDIETSLQVVSELRRAGIQTSIHMRCDSSSYKELLERGEATIVFGTAEELATSAIVLQQKQHDAGKRRAIAYRAGTEKCNDCVIQKPFPSERIDDNTSDEDEQRIKRARLEALDPEKCLLCSSFLDEWKTDGEFTRQSNYAVAAHDVHKERLVNDLAEKYGVLPENLLDCISPDDFDRLLEIEHIRWNRFHFLNNWRYAPGEKNKEERTHPYLVPFDELPRNIKDLDADSYATLFDVRK